MFRAYSSNEDDGKYLGIPSSFEQSQNTFRMDVLWERLVELRNHHLSLMYERLIPEDMLVWPDSSMLAS